VQLALIGLLLVLVLEVLFDVRDHVESPSPVWHDSFSGGLENARAEIHRRLARNGRARVRWIGVTMGSGWPFVQNLVLHAERTRDQLSAEIALLDPAWLSRLERSSGSALLSERSAASLSIMRQFLDARG